MAKGDIDFKKLLGGRPPMYETPEELENAMAEYFESTKNASGKYQPTIDGMTFHLGFATRQSLVDYGKKQGFIDVVNKGKLFIRSCYEKQLYGFAWAGASFALRNLGKEDWQDEVTQNQNHVVEKVTIVEKKREE